MPGSGMLSSRLFGRKKSGDVAEGAPGTAGSLARQKSWTANGMPAPPKAVVEEVTQKRVETGAAVKLQSGVRQKQAVVLVEGKKQQRKQETTAATKIQAIKRGQQARAEVDALRPKARRRPRACPPRAPSVWACQKPPASLVLRASSPQIEDAVRLPPSCPHAPPRAPPPPTCPPRCRRGGARCNGAWRRWWRGGASCSRAARARARSTRSSLSSRSAGGRFGAAWPLLARRPIEPAGCRLWLGSLLLARSPA
jgi:hypothetical protein